MTKTAEKGHNSDGHIEKLQDLIVQYAKCDEASQELNDERKDIRDAVKDMGEDPKAFVAEVNRSKRNLRQREGYDESAKSVRDVIGDMNMEELWSHVFERAEKKNKEREDKKAAKAAKKAEKVDNLKVID